MGVIVRWIGSYDKEYHDSRVFKNKKEVKDFIENLEIQEQKSAFLIDNATQIYVPFYEFYNKED